MVNVNEWNELKNVFEIKKGESYLEVFENYSPDILVKISQ